LITQPLILAAHVSDLVRFKGEPQRIERRAPQFTLRKERAEQRETGGFLIAVAGTLIGDIGRIRGALQERRALLVIGRTDLLDGAGEPQPGRRVVRRRCYNLAKERHAAAEIVLGKSSIGVLPDLHDRLSWRSSVGLDLGLERNRAVGKIAVPERLVRGGRGKGRNGQACGRYRSHKASADQRNHRKLSFQASASLARYHVEVKIVSRSWREQTAHA